MKSYINSIDVWGFEGAICGMRNPMNSNTLSDSHWRFVDPENDYFEMHMHYSIGDKDMQLAKKLIKAGNEHAKFLRFIHVQADWTMPRYFWAEADTYHFMEMNSQSTMHKLFDKEKPITTDQFEYTSSDDQGYFVIVTELLNAFREQYFDTENAQQQNEILRRAKQILPEGFLQTRTIDTNYQELWNMYQQRVLNPHRLPEWTETFGNWCADLPYFYDFFLEDGEINGTRD